MFKIIKCSKLRLFKIRTQNSEQKCNMNEQSLLMRGELNRFGNHESIALENSYLIQKKFGPENPGYIGD
jgi:hypothetical protein